MGIIFIAVGVLASTPEYAHLKHWLEPGYAPPWIHWFGLSHKIPWWNILLCHSVIALGTLLGGWRVVRTMGHNITRLNPAGGCCAETAGALTVIGASVAGIPVSTTHVITGSIIGVGTTRGLRAVRWDAGRRIVGAWVLTFPVAAFMSALSFGLVTLRPLAIIGVPIIAVAVYYLVLRRRRSETSAPRLHLKPPFPLSRRISSDPRFSDFRQNL